MTSTLLTTNTDAISRAADAIVKRKGPLTKNAVLNSFSAAIAGPGKDWGFLKNAPSDHFIQPGLSSAFAAKPENPEHEIWILEFDSKEDFSIGARLYPSKQAAIDGAVKLRESFWNHKHHPVNEVVAALQAHGLYDSTPEGDVEDGEDEDDWFDRTDLAIQISVRRIHVEDEASSEAPTPTKEEVPQSSIIIGPDIHSDGEQGLDEGMIFKDEQDLREWAALNNLEIAEDYRQSGFYPASEFEFTADFRAEVWLNDQTLSVDPQGDTAWIVLPHELQPRESDLDYLKHSTNAPEWVREWAGPFEIDMLFTKKP